MLSERRWTPALDNFLLTSLAELTRAAAAAVAEGVLAAPNDVSSLIIAVARSASLWLRLRKAGQANGCLRPQSEIGFVSIELH